MTAKMKNIEKKFDEKLFHTFSVNLRPNQRNIIIPKIKQFLQQALSDQKKDIQDWFMENTLEYDGKWELRDDDGNCKDLTSADINNFLNSL